ncbi:DsrE family protein [Rhodanobacter ginsengiterrae]|uniref:DsrE family protein n=1 Tax=Rhodanobacter ginsengiterrae TaxID=2008451 RepID=UPI003CEE3181
MKSKLLSMAVLACLSLMAVGAPSRAAQPAGGVAKEAESATTWVYPVIPKFGGVHPRPDVEVQPDPNVDYKIFVDVLSTQGDKGKPYGSLERLARLVNLLGYAKVPAEHVHIVALLDRGAGAAGMTQAASRKYLKHDNPNLEILHALKKAGVKLEVCSQAMAEHHMQDSDVDPAITITLSALTDPVVYGQQGYTYMQL